MRWRRLHCDAKPEWKPDNSLPLNPAIFKTPNYRLTTFGDLFTPRQLVALTTFSDLVQRTRGGSSEMHYPRPGPTTSNLTPLSGTRANAYADAVATYLGLALSRFADRNNSLCTWDAAQLEPKHRQGVLHERLQLGICSRGKQYQWRGTSLRPTRSVIPAGSFASAFDWIVPAVASLAGTTVGVSNPANATDQDLSVGKIVSTDPPYYDNIGYADLSDFFYVWLRRSMKPIFPDLFATLAVPKADELVASPYRHGSKERAETFFLEGMTKAMHRLAEQSHPAFPVTIYYAFKQSERDSTFGTASTGWDTFLDAVIHAGFGITGTWPMRTELSNRMIGLGTNALASSIVLVCRKTCSLMRRPPRVASLLYLTRP